MQLPEPRGPISEHLFDVLAGRAAGRAQPVVVVDDPIADDDLQVALWAANELHYRGFADVPAEIEWDGEVLALRGGLERKFLAALREDVPVRADPAAIPDQLARLVRAQNGPSLSRYLARTATVAEFAEFVMHRSVYHLKEADPHTWAIPRLGGAAKAALVAVQADEYGNGIPERMHSELFRVTMRSLQLDDTYGHYVNAVPGITLAISNLMSLFGLHRSLVGALAGHLAAFEMTSSLPNRNYSRGLRRLGFDLASRRFFDEHVTADSLHEQLAAFDLCGGIAAEQPQLADDVLFGAACCLHLDDRFAAHVLASWQEGRSSLRDLRPLAATAS